jgi:serine/threonine protein kinase
MPGQTLQARYRIENEMGRGGFGAVYRAWDGNLNRWCAIKENLQVSPEAQRQFKREATVLANLSHPNLPRVIDHFSLSGHRQYLVMDFVEGEDLASLSERQGRIPIDQAVKWISQVADSLVFLHSLEPPVFHRDIKPANIRITPKGQAMLVDFGLVKVSAPQSQTTVGAQAITPGYAPPEQYGHGVTDARTDVYALGATLYRLLTGQVPLESVQRLSGAELPPPNRLNPQIPPYISQAIEHAIAIDPERRYQSVAEFKAALSPGNAPYVGRPPAPAVGRDVPPIPRTIVVSPEEAYPSRAPARVSPASPAQKTRRGGSPLLMIGGGVIVLALFVITIVGLGGWLVISSQMSARSTEDARKTFTVVAQNQETSTEVVRSTNTAASILTLTAEPIVTATAQAGLTATAEAAANATALAAPTATAKARDDYISSLFAGAKIVYGPTDGTLPHDPANNKIEYIEADVSVSSFIVDVQFANPYPTSVGKWVNGLAFNLANDNQYRLTMASTAYWDFNDFYENNKQIDKTVADGHTSVIQTDASGTNLIRFVRKDSRGWVYINGQFVTELDLSAWGNLESIWVATGMVVDSEFAGQTTDYFGFTIWSLP